MTRRPHVSRLGFALIALVYSAPIRSADAQTAEDVAMLVASDSQCLDVEGNATSSSPPPSGARVIVARCNGRPSQRWRVIQGDTNLIQSLGGLCLSVAPATATTPTSDADLRVTRCDARPLIVTYNARRLRVSNLCLAIRAADGGVRFATESCNSSPAQQWEMR